MAKFELVCLPRRHKKDARWLHFILVAVYHIYPRPLVQIEHLEEIVPMGVLHFKMPIGIEHLYLKRTAPGFGLTKVPKGIDGDGGVGFHGDV